MVYKNKYMCQQVVIAGRVGELCLHSNEKRIVMQNTHTHTHNRYIWCLWCFQYNICIHDWILRVWSIRICDYKIEEILQGKVTYNIFFRGKEILCDNAKGFWAITSVSSNTIYWVGPIWTNKLTHTWCTWTLLFINWTWSYCLFINKYYILFITCITITLLG